MIVGWWTSGLVGCGLPAIGCGLTAIGCPLSADRYLRAFKTLTARTEILRFAQNDDVRRKAIGG